MPVIPIVEDDAGLRENFIESLFVYRRWREACAAKSRGTLAPSVTNPAGTPMVTPTASDW